MLYFLVALKNADSKLSPDAAGKLVRASVRLNADVKFGHKASLKVVQMLEQPDGTLTLKKLEKKNAS